MRIALTLMLAASILVSCQSKKNEMKDNTNPLLNEFSTPFGVPPFELIRNSHFIPAYEEAMRIHQSEIDAIVSNPEPATFENTLEAYDNSGILLDRIEGVFDNLTSSLTDDTLQEIAKTLAPMLSKHYDDILLNAGLFKRIEAVYGNKDGLNLTTEQKTFLEKLRRDFIRAGAQLPQDKQNRMRQINEEMSVLSLSFGDNVLAETNNFVMLIEDTAYLAGLPKGVVDAAAETAKEKGSEGKWAFTTQKPSLIPFLQYSEKRDLREKMLKAYSTRGDQGNQFDNKESLRKMALLRLERAKLLGYKTHADYVLEKNMAKEPQKVYDFLNQLMTASLPVAKAELAEMQQMADKEKAGIKIEAWDWWYYAEKIRKQKYDLEEESLRPYFKLEKVREGMFAVIGNLYGLKFIQRTDIPKYHKDIEVYEVTEANGDHIGILYMDYFPRDSKHSGAWMNSYRKQSKREGKDVTPVITTVFNFTKPSGDIPALLTFEEVSTMFHEMGHALHGLLSDCSYNFLSGTSVPRDFVELPSQIMENWAAEPEVLRSFAIHYANGDTIPDELITKMQSAKHFNQGFEMVEYLSASFLDMDWHTIETPGNIDVNAFENASMKKIGMIPEIIVRYRSTYFGHIFSGGYSAGYYSYMWAQVLDSDAFEAFKETSLFDQATAASFRNNILAKGGTDDPMALYIKFRGREPLLEPLLIKKGLKQDLP